MTDATCKMQKMTRQLIKEQAGTYLMLLLQIVTVNDYLARRDSEWVGQVHRFLGLEVGLVQANQDATERHKAYRCDVTYVTNSELGFGKFLHLRMQASVLPLVYAVQFTDLVVQSTFRTLHIHRRSQCPDLAYRMASNYCRTFTTANKPVLLNSERACKIVIPGCEHKIIAYFVNICCSYA